MPILVQTELAASVPGLVPLPRKLYTRSVAGSTDLSKICGFWVQ